MNTVPPNQTIIPCIKLYIILLSRISIAIEIPRQTLIDSYRIGFIEILLH